MSGIQHDHAEFVEGCYRCDLSREEVARMASACLGCGAAASDDTPVPNHCGECPPWKCEDCGGTNSLAENVQCPCWVSLEGMALADIKALFAASDLSIDIPRGTP